jgi:peptide/nickel transport system substrate-binding protein
MDERGIDRRKFLLVGSAFAIGTAATVAGCGGSSSGPGASPAATGSKPARGGTAKLAIGDMGNFVKMEPATVGGGFGASQIAYTAMYNGLVRCDGDLNVLPDLATDWTLSSDAKRWRCKLRSGVTFHDGKPLTAADVVFSLRRVFDKKVGSPVLASFTGFVTPAGIKAVDDLTVEIDMVRPNAFMSQLLTSGYLRISPEGTTDFSTANGTGPFKLQNFAAGQSIQMERNDSYFLDGRPYLDGLAIVANDDSGQRLQSVLAGDTDFADDLPPASFSTLKNSSVAQLLYLKGTYGVYSNAITIDKPYNDPRVLQALKYATDRERLNNVVWGGLGQVCADVLIPPNDPFYPADLKPFDYDPDKAKSLLKAAGYSDGIEIELYTSEGPRLDLATTFSSVVKDAGIKMKVVNWPRDNYWDAVWMKKPFATASVGHDAVTTTLASYILPSSPYFNETHYDNPNFEKWLNGALSTTDVSRQKELIGEILRDINANGADFIPAFGGSNFASKNRLQGVALAAGVTSADFVNAYLTEQPK